MPPAICAHLKYAQLKSYLWQLMHYPPWEREPLGLADRPSVNFRMIFPQLFIACPLILQALVKKREKGLACCEAAAESGPGFTRNGPFCLGGPTSGVWERRSPCHR